MQITESVPVQTEMSSVQMAREVKTKLWVYYSLGEQNHLRSFDFKSELDQWLAAHPVQIMAIIRGAEKKFQAVTKITLS